MEGRLLDGMWWDRGWKSSEVSMKGSAMKAYISEMVSLGEERDERVGVNIFLAGGCREEILVIKEEVE